jgi:two-component system, cell cycle sensor histidine kinase and response regulator CckA
MRSLPPHDYWQSGSGLMVANSSRTRLEESSAIREFILLAATGGSVQIKMTTEFVWSMSPKYHRGMAQHQRAEKELRRLNRALATVSKCNKVLVRATKENELLQEICESLVDTGGYRMAWVTFSCEDPDALLPTAAVAGVNEGYLEGINLTWRQVNACDGPIGRAIRTRRPGVVHDLAADPYFATWIGEATKRGYASCLALPLLQKTNVLGVIVIHASEVNAFDVTEVELLTELADNVAYGIVALRTRNELRSSEQRYRLLFEDNLAAVFHSSAGKLLDCNDAMCRMFGYSREEICTLDLRTLYCDPADRDAGQRLLYERGQLANHQVDLRRKDGSVVRVLTNLNLLHGEPGNAPVVVGVMLDITQVSKLQEQLLQSQKMEAVGRLAGGIAHDFNNLLMVIQSYAEMLHDGLPVYNPLRKNTREILKAAERAASLTSQMLAFSRKQIIAPKVLDLNAVIDNTAKMLERLIGEDIEFRVTPARSLWAIEADPDQIVQVLMNLCVNSRDAMPQGGTITITTENVAVEQESTGGERCTPRGDYVMLSVADTGTGISKELHAQIFEPFFTTREVGKGTGLGLSMIYGVVKQSGGYVWVDSEPGHGACFTIYLPKARETIAPETSPNGGGRPPGTETILVAEDEEALREAICDYLRGLGYTVFAASSGQQALLVADQQEHIDLLITDVVMPKMSGRNLSNRLGSLCPDVKTIYMSGYTDDAVLRHGIHEQGATFLQKPFSLGTLARKVRDTLQ